MNVKRIIKSAMLVGLSLLVITLFCVCVYVIKCIDNVRDIDVFIDRQNIQSCIIYDNNDNVIFDGGKTYNYTPLSLMSHDVIDAIISIEDKNFYKHNGLNYKRIIKAAVNNVVSNKIVEGASTISQQLIKNKYLTGEKTFKRKIQEAYLTFKLENKYTKDEILEKYLNCIYFGNGAYGIGNASQKYFDKMPNELTLSEACAIAGIVKSPYRYSPTNNYDNCVSRRNLILGEMLRDGKIVENQYLSAINEPLKIINTDNEINLYVQFVLDEASKILNMSKEEIIAKGYKIKTYQDKVIQKNLDDKIHNDKYYEKNEYGNIADSLAVIIDTNNYGVSAVSGRSKYSLVNFKRQPGSLIKPVLVYSPAFEIGDFYPSSYVLDEPINIDGYTPQNVSNKYYGNVTIEEAIKKSLNVPAVKICNDIGIDKCKEFASKCGLEFSQHDQGLSIALGGLTDGVTLKEITDAYSVYTNDGYYQKSHFVKEIISPQNKTLYANNMSKTYVYSSCNATLMTKTLVNACIDGTSKKLNNLPFQTAGKTGTVANEDYVHNSDAYSLAFTTSHIMSVWLGNYCMKNDHDLLSTNNGGTYATQIVHDVLGDLYHDSPPAGFDFDNNLITLPIDVVSRNKYNEIIIAEDIPEKYVEYCSFAKDNIPKHKKSYLLFPEVIDVSIQTTTTAVILNFDAEEFFDYDIYRYSAGEKFVLDTIKNTTGKVNFIDDSIQYNNEYKYYVVAKSKVSSNTSTSNILSAKISKDYNNLFKNQNSYIW